jgi:hypothetical protein
MLKHASDNKYETVKMICLAFIQSTELTQQNQNEIENLEPNLLIEIIKHLKIYNNSGGRLFH